MTRQSGDKLVYKGDKGFTDTWPLESYFAKYGKRPFFNGMINSGLRRGYRCEWEIVDGRLYLTKLSGWLLKFKPKPRTIQDSIGDAVTIATIFPGSPERVFAEWFSGTIKVPLYDEIQSDQGETRYVQERTLFFVVRQGTVVAEKMLHNFPNDPRGAPVPLPVLGPVPALILDPETEYQRIFSKSPTLQRDVAELKANGWDIGWGANDGGNHVEISTDPNVPSMIRIDMGYSDMASKFIQILAHLIGEASSGIQTELQSKEAYIESQTMTKAAGVIKNIVIQREIIANGGLDIGLFGTQVDAYNAIYNELISGKVSEAEARKKIAKLWMNERC